MGNRGDEGSYRLSRRDLLKGAAGLGLVAAAGGLLLPACGSGDDDEGGAAPADEDGPQETEGRLETTTIRLAKIPPGPCIAAQAMAEPFLREEGFTDIQYPVLTTGEFGGKLAAGDIDMTMGYTAMMSLRIDAGDPLVMLSGVHVGCWQIFGSDAVQSMRDFKGKTVAISSPLTPDGVFMAMMLKNVGLDLTKDVKLVMMAHADAARALSLGEIDGLAAFPPASQALEAAKVAHVVVDSMIDQPWSDYICCMAVANRTWMEQHPVAAKRALRAVMKGADIVAREPDRSARVMVDGGFTNNFDYACDILKKMPYDVWRGFDPADSVRFFALRLKEAGLMTSTPEDILERGTDFRYLEQLKRELKET